jgi:hypothetical protein
MADDVTLNSMSGGQVVATDDSGTGHVQIVKLAFSADGSRTPIEADADGLQVSVGNTVEVALGTTVGAPTGGGDKGVRILAYKPGSMGPSTLETPLLNSNGLLRVEGNSAEAVTTGDGLAGTEKLLPLGAYNDYFNSWKPLQSTGFGPYPKNSLWVALDGEAALAAGSNTIGAVTQGDGLSSGTLNPWFVANASGSTLAQGSATATTSATLIVSASTARRSITITNTGSVQANIGGSGVGSTTGLPLAPGASVTFDGAARAAFYGIAASGTCTLAYVTESD